MPYKLPELYDEDTTRTSIDTFLGVNKAPRIGDGEFSDMQNLTSDYLPNLAVRPRRGKPYLPSAKNPRSISVYAGDDGLFYPVYVDEIEKKVGETVDPAGAYLRRGQADHHHGRVPHRSARYDVRQHQKAG